jgi:DNA mismatch repair protein MutS2
MELEIPLADTAAAKGKSAEPKKASRRSEVEEALSRELRIIGMRVDEALPELERFLNQASLQGGGELRIIHGKGTGALMRAVHGYLDNHPLVLEFRKGEPFEGGEGATVVTLR